ncbi:MAG: shikimate dehydrogenase family protein [Alistipes sp.]
MRHFGLIGCPLGHSLSAEYFAAKFCREGIAADYTLAEIATIDAMPQATDGWSGFNVTIPYKKSILPYLAHLSDEAAAIGAVNCVRRNDDGSMEGFNTDIDGVRATFARLGATDGMRALVLGNGGAAAAVKFVLRERGMEYTTVSRSRERGDTTYDRLTPQTIMRHSLIINTTPVGMYPDVESAPAIPYCALTPDHTLFDVIYNPAPTRFLSLGAERGARIIGGETMFAAQAEASWRIWNGEER